MLEVKRRKNDNRVLGFEAEIYSPMAVIIMFAGASHGCLNYLKYVSQVARLAISAIVSLLACPMLHPVCSFLYFTRHCNDA